MNLPNKLTLIRIGMVPLFALFATLAARQQAAVLYLLAGVVFALASLTDMLDGQIARREGLVTNFGKFADPLADKILTTAAFLYMLWEGVCDPFALVLILFREFAVSGLRMLAAGSPDGLVIPANIWGKLKTVLQMLSISVFYFGSALLPAAGWFRPLVGGLCWACAAVTVLSGVTYLKACLHLLSDLRGKQ